FADAFIEATPFALGSLVDALLAAVRTKTGLDVKRADFKQDQLPAHLLMNLRVVDEHGRQLGSGRNLAGLKGELGGLARSAFQALAALKVASAAPAAENAGSATPGSGSSSTASSRTSPMSGSRPPTPGPSAR